MRFIISQPRLLHSTYITSNVIMQQNNTISIKPFDIIPGSGLGIPLNILQLVYTYQHYHTNIITPDLVIFQFMAGIFTYGLDRFQDSGVLNDSTDLLNYSNYKITYFNYLQDNMTPVVTVIISSYFYLLHVLYNVNEARIYIPVLTSTIFYRDFKKQFGLLKSTYIATLWTISTFVIPSVIHSHDYSVLNDSENILSLFLLMFSSSNLLDIQDYSEDFEANIETIPVVFGKKNAAIISYFGLLTSAVLFSMGLYDYYL